MGKLFIKTSLIVLVSVTLAACGNINAGGKNQTTSSGQIGTASPGTIQPAPVNYTLQKFTWDVSGSADINFTVVPSGSDFVINVARYNYRVMNVSLRMSQSESATIHNMLRNVFSGYDGFINGSPYNGTRSVIAELDKNGRAYTVNSPLLYSGNSAVLSELFQNITSRIYQGN